VHRERRGESGQRRHVSGERRVQIVERRAIFSRGAVFLTLTSARPGDSSRIRRAVAGYSRLRAVQ
jgi:hypothetical protein